MFKRQLFPFFFFFSGSLFSVDKAFRSLFAVHSTLCGFSQWRTESLLLFPFLFQISSLLFSSVLSSASRLFYHTFRLECRFSYAPPSPFFVAYYHSLCFWYQATFFHSISHQTKPTQPNKQTNKKIIVNLNRPFPPISIPSHNQETINVAVVSLS